VQGILANEVNKNTNREIRKYSNRNKELIKENNELKENFEALINIRKRTLNEMNKEESLYKEIEKEKKRARGESANYIDGLEFHDIDELLIDYY